VLSSAVATPARTDPNADRAAITARLQRWAAAFNAGDAAGTCDLFAPDLIATTRGGPDRGRDAECAVLAAVLVKPDLKFRYPPDIQEILVSGDLAVVRLVWTLTMERGGRETTSEEPGLDIFRRQSDGTWSISRFLAFSRDPD